MDQDSGSMQCNTLSLPVLVISEPDTSLNPVFHYYKVCFLCTFGWIAVQCDFALNVFALDKMCSNSATESSGVEFTLEAEVTSVRCYIYLYFDLAELAYSGFAQTPTIWQYVQCTAVQQNQVEFALSWGAALYTLYLMLWCRTLHLMLRCRTDL